MATIASNIISGNTTKLFAVIRNVYDNDDCKLYDDIYFAGTTEDELKELCNKLYQEAAPEFGQQIIIDAMYLNLDDIDLDEYDLASYEEDDDDTDVLKQIIEDNRSYLMDANIDFNGVKLYEYNDISDSILIHWSWETYIGYARKFHSFEYCYRGTDEMCVLEDRVWHEQTSVLISAEDIAACKNSTELRQAMIDALARFDKMGRSYDPETAVDEFLTELYQSNSRSLTSIYHLPTNDTYGYADED